MSANDHGQDYLRTARLLSIRDRLLSLEDELAELGYPLASMRVGATARSLHFTEHTRRKVNLAVDDLDEWD